MLLSQLEVDKVMNGVPAKVDAKITGVNVGRMAFYVTVIVTIAYLVLTKVE